MSFSAIGERDNAEGAVALPRPNPATKAIPDAATTGTNPAHKLPVAGVFTDVP